MLGLSAYDHTAGSQMIELLATASAGVGMLAFVLAEKWGRSLSWRGVMGDRPARITLGASIEMFGRALGTASYMPAWPLLSAGQNDVVVAYTASVAPIPIAAAFSAGVGLVVIFWPWLHRKFGRAALAAIPFGFVLVYLVAAAGSALIARAL